MSADELYMIEHPIAYFLIQVELFVVRIATYVIVLHFAWKYW